MELRAPAAEAARRRAWVIVALAVVAVASILVGVRPESAQATPNITEYSAGITSGASPAGITKGPDGNLWFTEGVGDRIGRINPTTGVVIEFSTGITPGSWPLSIAAGADGNLWFTETQGRRIGRINPTSGVVTEFSSGISPSTLAVRHITAGPDGNLWFTMIRGIAGPQTPAIGRITPAGVITEFTAGFSGGQLGKIVAGPDNNLWFTVYSGDRIGKITTAGVVTEFPIAGGAPPLQPYGITVGPGTQPDLWFTLSGQAGGIGRITTAGVITRFSSGATNNVGALDLATGGDGNLWFTQYPANRIGRITPLGDLITYSTGITGGTQDIVAAGDGTLWFTEAADDRIGRIFDLAAVPTTTTATTTTTASTTSTTVRPTTTTVRPTTTTTRATTTTTSTTIKPTTTTTTTVPTTTVPAGGTVSSDPSAPGPTASNPVLAAVTTPNAGGVSIRTSTGEPPPGYTGLGRFLITAPPATVTTPLTFAFSVATSGLPPASQDGRVTAFRNGVATADCSGATGADPDPCVASRQRVGNALKLVVRTSHASTWQVVTTRVGRLAGTDRMATAVAVSRAARPGRGASAAVLARSDAYPDALAGGPLAAAKGGSLLLTSGESLPAAVAAELVRSLKPGAVVFLLGGTNAITPAVASRLSALGFVVRRLAGADRYATSVAIANEIGNPARIFLATGTGFADALSAGPAAALLKGAVLLTNGSTQPGPVRAYLAAHPKTPRIAVGGAAASAVPKAEAIAGATRYETSSKVAVRFFPNATSFGLASGVGFADALAGASLLGPTGSPLVITAPDALPAPIEAWIRGRRATLTGGGTVLGGSVAVSDAVQAAAAAALAS